MYKFTGNSIFYCQKKICLNEHTVYLDGSMDDDEVSQYSYVYNDIRDVFQHALINGSETEPMEVYIAPYVYWIDNPEATDTLQKTEGYSLPYGMVVKCEYLHLHGLTDNPYQVVIAGNRGQSNGANGNYTLFHFDGDGLTMENLTLGNYCNVDLDYSWNPALNQRKRTNTITQAQLATLSGDKFLAVNCNFISRLNLRPVSGGKRSLYYNCHFESTDDALNGNAVYEKCSFDFYGGRPLYDTYGSGAVFLNCDFNSKLMNVQSEVHQYFTKAGGPVTAVDCRFHYDYGDMADVDINWTKYPQSSLRCYSYNLTKNGNAFSIKSGATVDLTGKKLLNAYRLMVDNKVMYNTYNLLRGNDDWDPMNRKETVNALGTDYVDVPTLMTIKSGADVITSGVDCTELKSEIFLFSDSTITGSGKLSGKETHVTSDVRWHVAPGEEAYISLKDNGDGSCTVSGCNSGTTAKNVLIIADTPDGLEAATELTVKPYLQEAPAFNVMPQIKMEHGALKLNYSLELDEAADESLICWYRCRDKKCLDESPALTAISRFGRPENIYQLTTGDVGYYIMAVITPKSSNSEYGGQFSIITEEPINIGQVDNPNYLDTDFHSFPLTKQPLIKAGFWTVDSFRPEDTYNFGTWSDSANDTPWVYGYAGNGCVGCGLYQGTQGARLMYTPVSDKIKDMYLQLTVDPAKTAGQGFGSADQYMDICVKFDTSRLSGYGLRIVRTVAASNAVSMMLVEYIDGKTNYLTSPVIASCYQTGCTIELNVTGSSLRAHVESTTPQLDDQKKMGWADIVDLEAEINPNDFGGICIQHTGSVGTGGWQNCTMLHRLWCRWCQAL